MLSGTMRLSLSPDPKPHSFHALWPDDLTPTHGDTGLDLEAKEADTAEKECGSVSYISSKSKSGASGSMVENIITPTSSSFSAFLFPVFHSCKEERPA